MGTGERRSLWAPQALVGATHLLLPSCSAAAPPGRDVSGQKVEWR